ncbi:MAG: enoyl-CoA hydratase/isomerase family protein [Parachlamydiaceae bacterium]|nr:enoyl-CoA hydratase/isomerase family protein [Parachlamydiaceae bacterium]
MMVTLNRPDKRNALNIALMEELSFTFEELYKDPSQRVVILNAQGASFCTGMDLHEAADSSLTEKSAMYVARLFRAIYLSPLVTIAAVQGDALAGGAGLVAACDIALATKEARFGFPETRRGLVAAQVATLLRRQIKMRDVRELLLMGESIDAQKAMEIGLINRVVEKEQLLIAATEIAHAVLKGAPAATRETKHLLHSLDTPSFYDELKLALSFHENARNSDEAKEGLAAFFEKRQPNWTL